MYISTYQKKKTKKKKNRQRKKKESGAYVFDNFRQVPVGDLGGAVQGVVGNQLSEITVRPVRVRSALKSDN